MNNKPPLKTFCPECGFGVEVDEYGFCVKCGGLASGSAVNELFTHYKEKPHVFGVIYVDMLACPKCGFKWSDDEEAIHDRL